MEDSSCTSSSSFLSALKRVVQEDRVTCILGLLVGIGSLIPLMAFEYLPMQDRIGHLAVVQAWRSLTAETWPREVRQLYELRGGLPPYLLYYGLLRFFGSVMPLLWADKLIILLYAVGVPLAFAQLLWAFGRDLRLTVLSVPFVISTPFIYGLMPNLLSVPLCLSCMAQLKRLVDYPSASKTLILGVTSLMLYMAHVSGVFAFALAGTPLFLHALSTRRLRWREALFFVPAALAGFLWSTRNVAQSGVSVIWGAPSQNIQALGVWLNSIFVGRTERAEWRDPLGSLPNIRALLEDIWISGTDEIVLLVVVITAATFSVIANKRQHIESSGSVSTSANHMLEAGALLFFVGFFLLPRHIHRPMYQWMTNARTAVPMVLLLLALPRGRLSQKLWHRLLFVPLFCAMMMHNYAIYRNFGQYDEQASDYENIVAKMKPGKRVLPLLFSASDGVHRSYPFLHLPALYVLKKGGAIADDFFVHPVMPLGLSRGANMPLLHWKNPNAFRWESFGRFYDYVVGVYPSRRDVQRHLPGATEQMRFVMSSGRFALYRSQR